MLLNKLSSKKAVTVAMAGLLTLGSVTPAFAAIPTVDKSTDIMIQTEAIVIDMTVPSSANFVFSSSGKNIVPENFDIENKSKAVDMYLKTASFVGVNAWEIANADHKLRTDEQAIKLKIGKKNFEKQVVPESAGAIKSANGSVTFGKGDFVVSAENKKTLSFAVERPLYTSTTPPTKAYTMKLKFDVVR